MLVSVLLNLFQRLLNVQFQEFSQIVSDHKFLLLFDLVEVEIPEFVKHLIEDLFDVDVQ